MAGKSKQQKKKRAQTQRRLKEEGKPKPVKLVVADGESSVLELQVELPPEKPLPEPEKPFDPSNVVANILKKDEVM